jgi:SAM-dependent methyltransferase
VDLWRRQLALVIAHGRQAQAVLEEQAESPDVSPRARTRLRAMAAAVGAQREEIVGLVGPSLGGPADAPAPGLPRGVVEYSYYLHRDWAWDEGEPNENKTSVDAIQAVMSAPELGRTLVLGAGGCRLAYDLHRRFAASETVVLDIDPYLFVIAEAVVRGAEVRLTESSLNVPEASRVAACRTLRTPAGPLDTERFHFLFANGLEPPFVDASFDTIVTPWFIDRVPTDLSAFIRTIKRLLRPRGRWINQGPLLYSQEMPIAQRYAREEVFDLAEGAGLYVKQWAERSRPYLVSPLTGSGKIESVLTFEATLESPACP